jgi:protoporphyrinogen oxidase
LTVQRKRAIVIGAGPAGLTAAYELLKRTDIVPLILEQSEALGGLSRTVNYKGNRIDIGGHRFFSKSDRVMQWWLNILPLEAGPETVLPLAYQGKTTTVMRPDCERGSDRVMLVRSRKSRIYFMRQLFSYPITLSSDTLRKLGLGRTMRIGLSYLRSLLFPIRNERNLEEFFINRFGRELYVTFFKSYTQKVWGLPCNEISAEWGAQRIKGLSISKTLSHMLGKLAAGGKTDLAQKNVETSLIEQFLYPKFGPGQMWEEVGRQVKELGGEILCGWSAEEVERGENGRIVAVTARNVLANERRRFSGDYFFSTMPVKDLIGGMSPAPPEIVRTIAGGLVYRDFITIGLLCDDVKLKEPSGELVRDNWIYVQEPDVLVGRLQIFNNWSPAMVADPGKVWIGLEYFCNETDDIWKKSDAGLIELAKSELESMGMVVREDVSDAVVIRMPKTYPAYFGSYAKFSEISQWVDGIDNLFLIGRNGMHKYNNQDHSMLTAMAAAENIMNNVADKSNLWAVNTEQEYHEEKKA